MLGYSYGLFRLSPVLEYALYSDTRPLSGELRDLGSYDLKITPVLNEIRDPAGQSVLLDEWEYCVHVPEMPE